jgi:KDO2-lipid IV(A) lauroyltransferase
MQFLFNTLSILPLWLLHILGWVLGWFAFLFSGVYRQHFLQHTQQAGYGFFQVIGAIGHAGQMAMETPRLWSGRAVSYTFKNKEVIEEAHTRGQGILILTPHLGSFEAVAQAYAVTFAPEDRYITALYRPAKQPWLQHFMLQGRQGDGLRIAPTNLTGVKQLMKTLRSGQAVGLLPDQTPPKGMGVWVPFFGKPAYTMTLAARLVQQTQASVVLCYGQRLSFGRGYHIDCQKLNMTLSDDIVIAVQQISQAMEAMISKVPEKYLWEYNRYRNPR